MANLLQSSQTQATTAPSFYTDYLSNIANKGMQAQANAQYVGAQPLQTKAFESICQSAGKYQPTFEAGQNLLQQAGGQNISGATTPYLQAATSASPLCAAKPLICQSANLNLGCLAKSYMSPYVGSAVQSLSDIAQRNIQQNIAPGATAAAVGSGQFGSKRGAQVLGQLEEQANQDLNSQIANLLNQGYGQALCAAKSKQGALAQLAGTTATAQQAQNQANISAAQTAGCAAYKQSAAQQQAGAGLGQLGTQGATANLACINALATLGGQQQTIGQNAQNFPLTSLTSLAGLLSGYTMPTSTKTTLCMSPLSAVGAVGSGIMGLLQCSTPGSGKSVLSNALGNLKGIFGSSAGATPTSDTQGTNLYGNTGGYASEQPTDSSAWDTGTNLYGNTEGYSTEQPTSGGYYDADGNWIPYANGGSVAHRAQGGTIGCGSMMGIGAAPAGLCFAACLTCTPIEPNGGVTSGLSVGCVFTQNRGALPKLG